MEDVVLYSGHLEYFTTIGYIFRAFGNFVVIWYFFPCFGILYQGKSDYPGKIYLQETRFLVEMCTQYT
jgi:hypothetical protein